MADIELEKFLFMKVSECLNNYTSQQQNWGATLHVACLVLENMIISNMEQSVPYSELQCVLRDLGMALKSCGQAGDRVWLLRLKASVERAERFANMFTQEIINVFQDNVTRLGDAINIDRHSVNVFSESFVRFHLIFQASKCFDYLQGQLRGILKLPPFITISQFSQGGACQGQVFHVRELYDCLKLPHNE